MAERGGLEGEEAGLIGPNLDQNRGRMFPMIGLLALIAIGGILAGLVSLLFKSTRFLAAYLILGPLCGSFLSFWLLWGGGLVAERLFGPSRWTSIPAVLGYAGGFVIGGVFGIYLAARINQGFSSRAERKRAGA